MLFARYLLRRHLLWHISRGPVLCLPFSLSLFLSLSLSCARFLSLSVALHLSLALALALALAVALSLSRFLALARSLARALSLSRARALSLAQECPQAPEFSDEDRAHDDHLDHRPRRPKFSKALNIVTLYRTRALTFEVHVQAGCSETSERSSSDTRRAIGEEMMFMTSIIACQMNCEYSSN